MTSMTSSKNNVLVTGGCGFVGRHLVKRLVQQGKHVIVVDNHYGDIKHIHTKGAVYINQDVRSFFRGRYKEYFSEVYHLAAIIGGRVKIDGDPLSVAEDLAIDAQFFKWLVNNQGSYDKVLYASSSAVYPIILQEKQNILFESMQDVTSHIIGKPDMTYGWTKLTGEYLAHLAHKDYGMHIACVRPFSGYGEDQSPDYPIPAIALRAIAKEDPLVVWGSGKQVRDFVYIDDCIDAMLLAIDKIDDGAAVNISTGVGHSFIDIANLYADIVGYKPQIKSLIDNPVGVQYRVGDRMAAEQLLGWKPKTLLRDGLQIVVDHLASQ